MPTPGPNCAECVQLVKDNSAYCFLKPWQQPNLQHDFIVCCKPSAPLFTCGRKGIACGDPDGSVMKMNIKREFRNQSEYRNYNDTW